LVCTSLPDQLTWPCLVSRHKKYKYQYKSGALTCTPCDRRTPDPRSDSVSWCLSDAHRTRD